MSGDDGEAPKVLIYAKQDIVSDYLRGKLEKEARKNWDKFYRAHENRFFKDRHYLHREFPDLLGDGPGTKPAGAQGARGSHDQTAEQVEGAASGMGPDTVITLDGTGTIRDPDGTSGGARGCEQGPKCNNKEEGEQRGGDQRDVYTCDTMRDGHVDASTDKNGARAHEDRAVRAVGGGHSGPDGAARSPSPTPPPPPGARVLLELGCGAGNTVFPLLEEAGAGHQLFVYAADFSSRAVQLVRAHPLYDPARVHAFVADATTDDLAATISPASVHAATLVFMLSAMSFDKMPAVLRNLRGVLRPGGKVFVRDYALGDLAQERLHEKQTHGATQKISDNFYARTDGTCAYYFSEELLVSLFRDEGFACDAVHVVRKEVCNRRKNIKMQRLWIQGVFSLQFGFPS